MHSEEARMILQADKAKASTPREPTKEAGASLDEQRAPGGSWAGGVLQRQAAVCPGRAPGDDRSHHRTDPTQLTWPHLRWLACFAPLPFMLETLLFVLMLTLHTDRPRR